MAPFQLSRPPSTARPPSPAERWYRAGVELVREGRFDAALEPLEQALAASVREVGAPYLRSMRSCYGVTVALVRGDLVRGRRLCEEAIADGPTDVELYINLARVYRHAARKDLAVEALRTALAIDPRSRTAVSIMGELGFRRPTVFPFLDRRHPLNKYVGLIRHRLQTR